MHPPRADFKRINTKGENSGIGLVQLKLINKTTKIELKKYLVTSKDGML